jgi:hypothetical protein
MTFQPGAVVNTLSFGNRPENVEVPHIENRTPSPQDINYPIGKRWIYSASDIEYTLTSLHVSQGVTTANWTELGTDSGALNTLTGDSGGAITPNAGNITLAGTASQIATAGSGSTITLSLIGPYTPATYTAHGVLIGEGSSSVVATAAGTNGQLLIGSTGADPAFSTLTSSGSTISITGGAHTLNIDLTAPVTVANGGTGATSLTGVLTGNGTGAITGNAVTQHGVLLGGASNVVDSLAVAATGTTLMGSTGADPAFTGTPSFSGSVTAGTSITATSGNITATNGNLVLGTAGNKLLSTSVGTTTSAGANSFGSVTLSSGTATVSTTSVTSSSLIVIWRQAIGASTGLGDLTVGTIVNGTSFVINSSELTSPGIPLPTDASVVGYIIIN